MNETNKSILWGEYTDEDIKEDEITLKRPIKGVQKLLRLFVILVL